MDERKPHIVIIGGGFGGKDLLPFRYVEKGSLATIGRSAAVADLGYCRLSGYVAWIA